ncbi:MAG: glycoside hydrolase family 88 protein [Spirochaetes bacterium]|nr:glycoside hydrolase family 88 protein [Spirochaetota bacterium]
MNDRRDHCLRLLEKAVSAALEDCTPSTVRWNYETGLVLKAVWEASIRVFGGRYDKAIKARVDTLVAADGSIAGYRRDEFNLDQINAGRIVLDLWKTTDEGKYRIAVEALLGQLAGHPRTLSGSFWHKRIYPSQVWLDGLYMCGPFYAACGIEFDRLEFLDDICAQMLKVRDVMKDPNTGLYFHAWDELKVQRWADPTTGLSPHVWGRAVGWLSMALVDILDYLPAGHSSRAALIPMFANLAAALIQAQDTSGLWWQVMDRPGGEGNYLETSASSMFAYSLSKGTRLDYLQGSEFIAAWERAIVGIEKRFVSLDGSGRFHLGGICKVAGLGGNPYRDGSYEYYLSEPIVRDDYKGMGLFILALVEACQKLRE